MQTFGGGEWVSGSTPSDRLNSENTALLEMLQEGMDVYDRNNERIGSIDEISATDPNTGEFYVTISRGLFGGEDCYLPSSYLTVSSVQGSEDEKQVGVAVPKDQLAAMGWDRPPRWAGPDGDESAYRDRGTIPDQSTT